jgi:hypothetical protein
MKRRDYARLTADIGLTNARVADEKTVAERTWLEPLKVRKEQKPCDAGLSSDDSKQLELAIPADLSIPEFLRRAA